MDSQGEYLIRIDIIASLKIDSLEGVDVRQPFSVSGKHSCESMTPITLSRTKRKSSERK